MSDSRRTFFSRLLSGTLLGGLGTSAVMAGSFVLRFLYPRPGLARKRRVYLAQLSDLPPGQARSCTLPGGETAVVTNTGEQIVALSDVCPHLGCKVRWDDAERGFVCPCHGGFFSKEGKAMRGPPAEEGKDLKRYEVSTVGESAFIEIEENLT
jgi:nitrite reductase/ring-hydroxylating ferredoxin subunit